MPFKNTQDRLAYQRRWQRERRAEWIAENGPCAICGGIDSLQVDHRDPTEKVSHRIWSWAPARRLAELAKCQVLCRPCHVAKTRREVADGTLVMSPAGRPSRTRFAPGERRSCVACGEGFRARLLGDVLCGSCGARRRSWAKFPDKFPDISKTASSVAAARGRSK